MGTRRVRKPVALCQLKLQTVQRRAGFDDQGVAHVKAIHLQNAGRRNAESGVQQLSLFQPRYAQLPRRPGFGGRTAIQYAFPQTAEKPT